MPRIKRAYTEHFPAVRIKIDKWQYASIFSSELLVISAAILVAGFNIWFFKVAAGHDQSLVMNLLHYHSDFNNQLVLHNNTVKTVVERPGFFNEAHAENIIPASDAIFDQTNLTAIEDDVIIKPNPASIQGLVSQQVKIYSTETGDTLSSIAKKFDTSINSIKWSNNLPSDTIKPGWFLIIPPANGVVVKITDSNTTIPDLAYKYKVTSESIVIANGRKNAEDIPDVGQYLFIKDGRIDPPPVPVAKKTNTKLVNSDGSKLVAGSHLFPPGFCTWYVASKVKVTWGGNANRWPANAKAQGYKVDRNPVGGSIGETGESPIGHVVFIEKVVGDDVYISEMNYKGWNKKSNRVISKSKIRSVIHP